VECVQDGKDSFKISEEFHIRTKMNVKGYHKRSPAAIERRIKDLPEEHQPVDESKPLMHRKPWGHEDDEMLLHYESMAMSREEIASYLNRTESAVENRLQVLKSQKSTPSKVIAWLATLGNGLGRMLFGSGEGGK